MTFRVRSGGISPNARSNNDIFMSFFKITKNIVDIAKTHSKGRVISFLEGGYDLQALSESIIEHLNALKTHV